MRISDWSSDVCSSDLRYRTAQREALDRLEARRDLAVHRVDEVGELFVAASDLDVEHVAEIGVEFVIAGEAVVRGVDIGAWHETAEHLRTDARPIGIAIHADSVPRGYARDDSQITVRTLRAQRQHVGAGA